MDQMANVSIVFSVSLSTFERNAITHNLENGV